MADIAGLSVAKTSNMERPLGIVRNCRYFVLLAFVEAVECCKESLTSVCIANVSERERPLNR